MKNKDKKKVARVGWMPFWWGNKTSRKERNLKHSFYKENFMTYKEETRDLFSVTDDYYLVHCISADFGMGKGIVVEFNKRFDMKRKLQSKYPDYVNAWHSKGHDGDCILEDRVLNLITKERYFHKPTYKSLTTALMKCREICLENNIMKLAMPVIGCGLDRLEWDRVSEIIRLVFKDTDVEILVCKL